jgi:hypothetical protein
MRPRAKAPAQSADTLSKREELQKVASFEALISKMCGVGMDRYEQWRDSMSDEYFLALIDRLCEKDTMSIFLRVT